MLTAKANANGTVDLVGKQGTTWNIVVEVFTDEAGTVPMNLATCSAVGSFKETYQDESPLLEFLCTILPYDEFTNPDNNKIEITAEPAMSSALTTFSGVYDIEVTDEVWVERILEGTLTISPEVTK